MLTIILFASGRVHQFAATRYGWRGPPGDCVPMFWPAFFVPQFSGHLQRRHRRGKGDDGRRADQHAFETKCTKSHRYRVRCLFDMWFRNGSGACDTFWQRFYSPAAATDLKIHEYDWRGPGCLLLEHLPEPTSVSVSVVNRRSHRPSADTRPEQRHPRCVAPSS